jgi:hypothetical protein
MSLMGKRMECRGSALVRKLDEVEGGGAHDAFSRAKGGEERTRGWRSLMAQWSSIKAIGYK